MYTVVIINISFLFTLGLKDVIRDWSNNHQGFRGARCSLVIYLLSKRLDSAIFYYRYLRNLGVLRNTWGRPIKIQAAQELFLYTVFGCLIMFIAVLILYLETGTTYYQVMLTVPISTSRQYFLWDIRFRFSFIPQFCNKNSDGSFPHMVTGSSH